MSSPRALFFLLLRPWTLALAGFVLAFAALLALVPLGVQMDISAIRSPAPGAAARDAVWRLVVLIPAALGFIAAGGAAEVRSTLTGWMLPGLRSGLLSGTLLLAGVGAATAALLASRGHAPLMTVAAAATALLWFALPRVVLEPAYPRAVRWPGAALFVLVLVRPDALAQFAAAQPLVIAAVASGGFTVILWHGLSASLAREQFRRRRAGDEPFMRWLEQLAEPTPARSWRGSLATRSVAAWLRAATYETGKPFLRPHALQAMLTVVVVWVTNMPFLLTMGALGLLNSWGTQLRAGVQYPLTRAERARIAFAGALFDAVAFSSFALIALLLAATLGLPRIEWLVEDTRYGLAAYVIALGAAFALAPVAQFFALRALALDEQPLQRLTGRAYLRHVVVMVAYAGGSLALFLSLVRSSLGAGAVAAIIAGVAALVHALHWLLVQRFFARADLLAAR